MTIILLSICTVILFIFLLINYLIIKDLHYRIKELEKYLYGKHSLYKYSGKNFVGDSLIWKVKHLFERVECIDSSTDKYKSLLNELINDYYKDKDDK